jgi:hypothetical protein
MQSGIESLPGSDKTNYPAESLFRRGFFRVWIGRKNGFHLTEYKPLVFAQVMRRNKLPQKHQSAKNHKRPLFGIYDFVG